ncbi:MAG TPA: GlcNAc-PI de-N-acetylase [Candidatus Jacksonbacteria bacterium]|nr:MAG: hypothetical protein UW45_C0005G0031 [Parcubacteria group bacterium GW2011_GWC2_44_22]OGY76449.1 MAG: hypothetical protein A2295_02245 [Candidatus Jacksonbacteria bacterium RIFOXYB2_FULL_44_15]OGY76820.1 MAG: hypothetical protein A2240_04580 [Candidatus Jacksonbacteria bacterium RIFOXYA2_FULL_43_12]OGY82179.1 MAG: hypothetical protein A2550_05750 [Candidatus Jacksonbacteria bacterium RIFOXYD2_FULL_43_21]HBH45838.1 GlcNAc-PI de-N-acetylase [Candidatus Jacksonbacteria bacterium]
MANNILLIAAHPDDEILGAGGTLLKHSREKDSVNLLILGDGITSRDIHSDVKARQHQAKRAAKALGARRLILKSLPDNQFDTIPLLEITKIIEQAIIEIKPQIIYTHHLHDLNIDHQLTAQAVLTACRPQPDFCVKKILSFETPSATEWQFKEPSSIFCPNVYNNITEFIDLKINILKIYQSELRQYPHPRSTQGIKILARYRGQEVGFAYAEAFQIIRLLND